MPGKKKAIDQLPESFETDEEAGKFWDTHSLADYEEFLEPADIVFHLEKRTYEVRIAEDVFQELQAKAKSARQSVPKTIDKILRKELSLAK